MNRRATTRRHLRRWVALGGLLLGLVYSLLEGLPTGRPASGDPPDAQIVGRLFEDGQSGVVVEGRGVVERVLRDDLQGSRHQRFILRLETDQTLLVSHNIDLAPRVSGLTRGDDIEFRGEYEWNDQGGVIHWTHHDPDSRRPGGWLRHAGTTYR